MRYAEQEVGGRIKTKNTRPKSKGFDNPVKKSNDLTEQRRQRFAEKRSDFED